MATLRMFCITTTAVSTVSKQPAKVRKNFFSLLSTVLMTADGSSVDMGRSDRSVVVYDPATGKRRMLDPNGGLGVLSVEA